MNTTISLNGDDWLFKDFLGEDWVWRSSVKPNTRDVRWWRRGTVPGSVHRDLLELGEIPHPYYERNSLLVEWVPARTWVYKKTFRISEEHQGKRIGLIFKGIDYNAHMFLNGEAIGSHEGMYTEARFEIGDKVKFGEDNLLAVVLERAPDEEPQVSKTSYVHTHKSRMTYWWDFCPRMIHIGIWDGVYLEVTGPVRIGDVFVRPQLYGSLDKADISVAVKLQSDRSTRVQADVRLFHEGVEIAAHSSEHALAQGETAIHGTIRLDKPKLWWPNGMGKADLYEARVTVTEIGQDQPSDSSETEFGIRSIELIRNETEDSTARPYTFVVNGRKVYIKGWNWVPIDAMYGVEQPEKLVRLLKLAEEAHVNMLRVWGGGLIEKDSFYHECNKRGIMVWQEFIQSSSGIANKPSEDPNFIEMMVKEAEQIIPRKRNHPSLAVWCGGNELQDDDGVPLDDSEPVLEALADAVRRLDPDRHWFPTSPTGRVFSNTLETIEKDPLGLHDVHGPWEHQGLTAHYTLYNRGTSLFHSEFGVEGMTNLKALNHTISKERQWPAGKDNPVYFHRGSWWNNEELVQASFGGEIGEVETLIRASQFLQAEGLRYAVEANLRRQYQSSGTLPWQFNEPFPNAFCTSALDYYAEPKAVYYAVRRAYRPLSVTARFDTQAWGGRERFEAQIWAANAAGSPYDRAALQAVVIGSSGKAIAEAKLEASVNANGASMLGRITAALTDLQDDIFFLVLRLSDSEGFELASSRYVFSCTDNLKPLHTMPQTSLESRLEKNGKTWTAVIANTGRESALCVRLDDGRELEASGYVYFEDNHFSLLPGESKRISIEWSGIPEEDRRIRLSGWNTRMMEWK